MRIRFGAAFIALFSITAAAAAQTYHVASHWKIGGQGGWDYLVSDDAAHRLYVTHNSRVEVLDTTNGRLIGAVTGLKSTHGVALNPDGKTGYISDGAGNSIVVFDCSDLSVKATVAVGTNPDGIAFEPTTKTVWAFNGRSNNVSVLDTAYNRIVATILLPGKPEFPQVDGHGALFVNIEDRNAIVKLDAATRKVVAIWTMQGCESPSGMAIDHANHRLFSVCDGNKMGIVDFATGKLLGLASIGNSPDAAAFDAKSGLAFSSNGGDGSLSVIDTTEAKFPTVQTLQTAKGARTMAFDASTGKVFIASAQFAVAATAAPHAHLSIVPGSFEILVVEK